MKNKIIIIGLVIVISVVGGAWYISSNKQVINTKQDTKQETTEIKIAYLPVVHALPLFTAIEKGYFKDAGLDVKTIKFESPNQIVDALLSGQVDFGDAVALGIAGVAESKNPGKIKVYGVNGEAGENSGENIIISKESTLKSISDLKGKKFCILAGTIQWQTIAREILWKNGLDMDKDLIIEELAPSVQIQALSSGQVDAILALEPIPTVALDKEIGKILVKAPAKEYIASPFWYGAQAVRAEFIEENPDVTKKIIEIMKRVIDEINLDFDRHRQYLKKYTSLTEELTSKVPPVNFKTCESLNDRDIDSIKKFYATFKKYEIVEKEIDPHAVLYCK